MPVNWCPALGTVLANEEVIDGKSERGNHPVVRMPLRQWMLRITAYAERLLDDLADGRLVASDQGDAAQLDRPSEGAEVDFPLVDAEAAEDVIRVFTTRPDTLFGATYMVLSPEHPLVDQITTCRSAACASMLTKRRPLARATWRRTELAKKKTGVFTGAYAINPVNGAKIPIWIADYVLASYGTGAIMAVPAHDERDFEFAKQFELPIPTVVRPPEVWLRKTGSTLEHLTEPFADEGIAINSGPFDGLPTAEFKQKITAGSRNKARARPKSITNCATGCSAGSATGASRFRSCTSWMPPANRRDWSGPLTEAELPLCLPEMEDYKPSGKPEPPLGKATDWVNVTIDGKHYRRETNTMPQWAGSCWYYLRYLDPRNDKAFCDPTKRNTGCRSISTSAAPSMPCCTCSTRASGTRCCSIAATCTRRSRFRSWSTRA